NYSTLYGVTCASASDCWAIGDDQTYVHDFQTPNQTLTEHWDGTSWSIVSSPNVGTNHYNYLAGVTCASASDCWAVGTYFDPQVKSNIAQTVTLPYGLLPVPLLRFASSKTDGHS